MKLHRKITPQERAELESDLKSAVAAGNAVVTAGLLVNQLLKTQTQAFVDASAAREKCSGVDVKDVFELMTSERRCELLEQTVAQAEQKMEGRLREARVAVFAIFQTVRKLGTKMEIAKIEELTEFFRPHFIDVRNARAAAEQTDTVKNIDLFFRMKWPFDTNHWEQGTVISYLARWTEIAKKILDGEDFIPDIEHEKAQSATA